MCERTLIVKVETLSALTGYKYWAGNLLILRSKQIFSARSETAYWELKIGMASTVSLLCLCIVLAVLTSPVICQFRFMKQAWQGGNDMWRAYQDMRDANYKGADKYFHARGNYDAAQRGPGGKWIAGVISDAREGWQGGISGRGAEDSAADQEANKWGRNGGDPNKYRPKGLPDKYK